MLAGLVPGMPSAKALCRITDSIAIDTSSHNAIDELQALVNKENASEVSSGWIVMLGYELGRSIEPSCSLDALESSIPPVIAMRWEGAWVEHGDGLSWIGDQDTKIPLETYTSEPEPAAIGAARSSMGRRAYIDRVVRTLEYIKAGDIYQANIAHHLSAPYAGSGATLASALFRSADPAFGAAFNFNHAGHEHSVVSISPELFLDFDPITRLLSTRPMKGTRPAHADPDELFHATKDRAELNMIVDLMRNDLGRVCDFGSMRVTMPRTIERHGSGVLQATASVQGRMRESCDLSDALRACFPPGSVTGAPKIRAMQIIEELEARPRGPYCGSILVINDAGAFVSSVGIRTAHLTSGVLSYAAGAGIVADSVPEDEWEETLVKASVLETALGIDLSAVRASR